MLWIFMESEEPEIRSNQASKRDRTLKPCLCNIWMSPKRKRHGLPLQPEIPQFWATFLHIMTRQDLNLHLVITSWITTTIWQDFSTGIINYRFLTMEANLKALYIFRCFFTTSSVKLFVVNVKIFAYNCVLSEKGIKTLTKPFTFWKWKHN